MSNGVYTQNTTQGDANSHRNSGFMDFNGYYDTREFSVMTLNLLANLSGQFQYFSLTNFEGPRETSDLGTYYSEQNLRWGIKKGYPIQLSTQWVLRSGINNDDLRLGVLWRLNNTSGIKDFLKKINLNYFVCFHFFQFREKQPLKYFTQVEHIYKLLLFPTLLKKKLYLGGFADQNLIRKGDKVDVEWVTEHQLGYCIIDALYLVAEYRVNDFWKTDKYGLGYGLEYKIQF
jgi:hypothetical protein